MLLCVNNQLFVSKFVILLYYTLCSIINSQRCNAQSALMAFNILRSCYALTAVSVNDGDLIQQGESLVLLLPEECLSITIKCTITSADCGRIKEMKHSIRHPKRAVNPCSWSKSTAQLLDHYCAAHRS